MQAAYPFLMLPSGYPVFTLPERIADGIIHLAGAVLAIVGTVLLIVFASLWADGAGKVAAVSVYAGFLTLSILASAVYHMTPWDRFRPALRRVDHAAIFLKIAGTYTAVAVLIGSAFAYLVLAAVWAAAAAGAAMKLLWWKNPGWIGTALYLALGWGGILLFWPLMQTAPLAAPILVLAGGLLYSAGTVFFGWERLRFSLAIWHGLVLAASGCFYAAIAVGTFA